jgi:hypothetical protein
MKMFAHQSLHKLSVFYLHSSERLAHLLGLILYSQLQLALRWLQPF